MMVTMQYSTILYFFVVWDLKYDQNRNPNINNRDHLVGQLTSVDDENYDENYEAEYDDDEIK